MLGSGRQGHTLEHNVHTRALSHLTQGGGPAPAIASSDAFSLTTAHPTRVPTCDLPVLCSSKHELRMVNFFLYWVVWCLRLFTAISLKEVAPLLDLNDSPWPAHLPTDSKGDAAASSSDAYTSVGVAWQSHRAGQIDKSQLRRDQADSPLCPFRCVLLLGW